MTKRLRHPDLDADIAFNHPSGKAQVPQDVGEQAVELYATVEPVESGAAGGAADDDGEDEG